ncbi:MAG: excinuclease ABC subunit UvrC [Bacteroidales bacterium]
MVKTFKDQHHLQPFLKTLPDRPGVYQYFDSDKNIIYVGKAKSLRKRVMSYFSKDKSSSGKVAVMIRKIAFIEHIVVESELDALLLENNLIKQFQPRYNILLKDDKTFPWICIKNEPFPRLFPTRNLMNDGSEYFGPYASVKIMNNLLGLIRQLYPLRSCNFSLTKTNIESGKFKVCLEYHIRNCKGPCEGFQVEEEYMASVAEIRHILKGNINAVIRSLKGMMDHFAGMLEFEKAQAVKERLLLLEKFQSKSTVVNPKIHDVDVFSWVDEGKASSVNYLRVIDGAIVQSHNVELRNVLEESREEVLLFAITDIRQRMGSTAPEIIVPFEIQMPSPAPLLTVPKKGDKLRLLELSQQNLKYFVLEKKKRQELTDPERHTRRIMQAMREDLRLTEDPVHIECFDNSNLQGTNPVAAMVVFRNGRPSKSEYRHYNIRTVKGPDDFASMEEIIFRRYSRVLAEEKPLPQLIIVDGGKGQLSSAVKSLEKLGLRGKIAIMGIAKKLEEIYYPDDPLPLHIDKRSETLRVIQHARNEAHRFGITHHRSKRDKEARRTALTDVPGIGDTLSKKLLARYKSLAKIMDAGEEEIAAVIGKTKAKTLFAFLQRGDETLTQG